MWRLLQKLTGYSSLVDYNGEVTEKLKNGGFPPPLDRCTVAGCAKLTLMLKHAIRRNFFALSPALEFLSIRRRDGYADFILKSPDGKQQPRKIRFTNNKYLQHLSSLIEDKILEECKEEEINFFRPKGLSTQKSLGLISTRSAIVLSSVKVTPLPGVLIPLLIYSFSLDTDFEACKVYTFVILVS